MRGLVVAIQVNCPPMPEFAGERALRKSRTGSCRLMNFETSSGFGKTGQEFTRREPDEEAGNRPTPPPR